MQSEQQRPFSFLFKTQCQSLFFQWIYESKNEVNSGQQSIGRRECGKPCLECAALKPLLSKVELRMQQSSRQHFHCCIMASLCSIDPIVVVVQQLKLNSQKNSFNWREMMVKRLPSPWNFFSVNLIWSNRRHNSSLKAKKKFF